MHQKQNIASDEEMPTIDVDPTENMEEEENHPRAYDKSMKWTIDEEEPRKRKRN